MARRAPRCAQARANMSESDCDVAIVGTGPTGLVLAHFLAQAGVRTWLIEKASSTVDEARAVSIDDESLRSLQTMGMLERFLPMLVQSYGVHYYSWRNRLFAKVEPTSTEYGHPKRNAFRQQQLVALLREGLQAYPHVQLRFGHELVQFTQSDAGVQLQVQHQGQLQTMRCQWLVGCDGGRSTVRQHLGIEWMGSTYAQQWLIADLIGRSSSFRHTRTYCDPQRPAIRLPGPQSTVRYEFMLKPGETAESVLSDSNVRAWIAQREPTDADLTILRKVVYTFHARIATNWRVNRVLLAGDAAHLTPPFAGQGMNSGVRDASNLAWKLAAVVHGQAQTSLLDTYQQERAPHAWSLIQMALRIGIYMQPRSVWGAALAQGLLGLICLVPRFRDHVLHLKFKPKPRFQQGFFDPMQRPGAFIPAGQLLPQPRVEAFDGQRHWLDDIAGPGWALLQWADAPALPMLALPGLTVIRLLRAEEDFLSPPSAAQMTVRDVQGVMQQVLDSAHAQAVLVRPDRYVLAYLDDQPESAHRLQAVLHAHGMDNQSLKA